MVYKCLNCNKKKDQLKERFFNTYKFPYYQNNKFILLLRNGVYPYGCMDNWEKFNETMLLEKEDFYNYLNMEDITHGDITDYCTQKDFVKIFK